MFNLTHNIHTFRKKSTVLRLPRGWKPGGGSELSLRFEVWEFENDPQKNISLDK